MNKIVEFPGDSHIQEQAALWIARMDRKLSTHEQIELQAWLTANSKHRPALLEMAALWDRTSIVSELAALFPLSQATASTWHPALPAIAASLLIAAVTVGFWLNVHRSMATTVAQVQAQAALSADYQTAIGEQRTVNLPDHSVLTLNTNTRVKVHYSVSDRRLELISGEAHFKVAKGDARVFTVQVGENQFKAVGTAFNIRVESERKVALTVTEGRVKVLVATELANTAIAAGEPTQIMVDAGREVLIDNTVQTVEQLPPEKLQTTIAWTHGMIAFNGQPLEQAIREVSRYSTVRLQIADDEIRNIPVSGYFKVGDVDGLLAALRTNFSIDVSNHDGTLVLHQRQ